MTFSSPTFSFEIPEVRATRSFDGAFSSGAFSVPSGTVRGRNRRRAPQISVVKRPSATTSSPGRVMNLLSAERRVSSDRITDNEDD